MCIVFNSCAFRVSIFYANVQKSSSVSFVYTKQEKKLYLSPTFNVFSVFVLLSNSIIIIVIIILMGSPSRPRWFIADLGRVSNRQTV